MDDEVHSQDIAYEVQIESNPVKAENAENFAVISSTMSMTGQNLFIITIVLYGTIKTIF